MARSFSSAELDAYLDEALPPESMAAIEAELRRRPELAKELAAVNARRDRGVHSLGEIWRSCRLTCPTRDELGNYLLGALPVEAARYVGFHLDEIGCRVCQANIADLKRQQAESADAGRARRGRLFESSAGMLRAK